MHLAATARCPPETVEDRLWPSTAARGLQPEFKPWGRPVGQDRPLRFGTRAWELRRIGDLNPGGCCHPTALAVLLSAGRAHPGMFAIAPERRSQRLSRA